MPGTTATVDTTVMSVTERAITGGAQVPLRLIAVS